MATNISCTACENIRENSPDFYLNGVTDDVCTALKNNDGFSTTSKNDDCTDIGYANDCLIGNMSTEVKSFGVCDWKKFMRKFIPNVHTVLKAINCALCGLWTYTEKHECEINYLYKGYNFKIGENTTGTAYAVAGKGVTFLTPKQGDEHTSDLHLNYIAGGLIIGGGSFIFHGSSFDEQGSTKCYNFDDDGDGSHFSYRRQGNGEWFNSLPKRPANGGELVCEFRIKKSAFPEIKKLYGGLGQETGGGAYHVAISVFDGDDVDEDEPKKFAYGQHGWCKKDGTPDGTGYSAGHEVPSGWIYVQVRMSYITALSDGHKYSPRYWMGVRFNQDKIDC